MADTKSDVAPPTTGNLARELIHRVLFNKKRVQQNIKDRLSSHHPLRHFQHILKMIREELPELYRQHEEYERSRKATFEQIKRYNTRIQGYIMDLIDKAFRKSALPVVAEEKHEDERPVPERKEGVFDLDEFQQRERGDNWDDIRGYIPWELLTEYPLPQYSDKEYWNRVKAVFDDRVQYFFATRGGVRLKQNKHGKFTWKTYIRKVLEFARTNDPKCFK